MVQSVGLLLLRCGIGLVFLIFGFDKFPHPADWVVYMPSGSYSHFANSLGLHAYTVLKIQGLLEFVIGLHLLVGVKVRFVSGLASLMLVLIISVLGFDHTAIRDLGLLGAALSICFLGGGTFSMDHWLSSKSEKKKRMITSDTKENIHL